MRFLSTAALSFFAGIGAASCLGGFCLAVDLRVDTLERAESDVRENSFSEPPLPDEAEMPFAGAEEVSVEVPP
jgi:hypothetical protein